MQAADLRDETSGSYRAVVTMTKDEAVRLDEALTDAVALYAWTFTLPAVGQASGVNRSLMTERLQLLQGFQAAHREAHGLGGSQPDSSTIDGPVN